MAGALMPVRSTKKVPPSESEKGIALAPSAKDLNPWYSDRDHERTRERETGEDKRCVFRATCGPWLASFPLLATWGRCGAKLWVRGSGSWVPGSDTPHIYVDSAISRASPCTTRSRPSILNSPLAAAPRPLPSPHLGTQDSPTHPDPPPPLLPSHARHNLRARSA